MTSYSYLVTHIQEACENDGTEFLDNLPKMINLAEERMTRDLDDYGLTVETSVAVSAGVADFTLPTGTRIVRNFRYKNSSGSRINLLLKTDEYLTEYWPVSASTGDPVYYARVTDTKVRIAPTPVSTVDGKIIAVARPTALTSTTPTNYFTEFCYDALFNAVMVEAHVFMKNASQVGLYEQRYKDALNSLRNQARRTRRDDMQAQTNPAGGDNTVIQGVN